MINSGESIGIYVHIPYCLHKCGYCDFYSVCDYRSVDNYVVALCKHMKMLGERHRGRNVDTVYIGGGTPTSLSAGSLAKILSSLSEAFRIDENAEFTVEANPATLDDEKLSVLTGGGMNRLSLGLQSSDDGELARLSRIHDYGGFLATYELALKYIDNISVDPMYGLPCQTMEMLYDTISKVTALEPTHISLYGLKIEEGTPFSREKLTLPDENTEADMYLTSVRLLGESGYRQYEISNFAKQGRESRHNLRYWKRGEYLGIGAAAHSFIDGERYSYTRSINDYITSTANGKPIFGEYSEITRGQAESETVMLSLRLCEGLSLDGFKDEFGRDFYVEKRDILQKYIKGGFMNMADGRLFFTAKGFLVSNYILAELI